MTCTDKASCGSLPPCTATPAGKNSNEEVHQLRMMQQYGSNLLQNVAACCSVMQCVQWQLRMKQWGNVFCRHVERYVSASIEWQMRRKTTQHFLCYFVLECRFCYTIALSPRSAMGNVEFSIYTCIHVYIYTYIYIYIYIYVYDIYIYTFMYICIIILWVHTHTHMHTHTYNTFKSMRSYYGDTISRID